MTADAAMLIVVDALGLPAESRVDVRVPKKLLVEQGAPTVTDKKAIQEGIDELQWFAACKPTTIGVPAYTDEVRDYLEIAVVGCAFRKGAKAARLIELIHRAIPYPVFLMTTDQDGLTVSAAHKRRSQNEAGKIVIDEVVLAPALGTEKTDPNQQGFLESLALTRQPRSNLYALYEGWLSRIEALNAARLNGTYSAVDDPDLVESRRDALGVVAHLARQITGLRAQVKREKQMGRRVDLNLQIQRLEADLTTNKKNL